MVLCRNVLKFPLMISCGLMLRLWDDLTLMIFGCNVGPVRVMRNGCR